MGSISSLSLSNKNKRTNRAIYWLPISILLLLSILFFRSLLQSQSYPYLINGSFILLFVLSIIGLVAADYYYDIYKQRRKLLQDYTSPPKLDAINEVLNSLNTIQVNEIMELLQKVQSVLAESLGQTNIHVALLYRESTGSVASLPSLKVGPYPSLPLTDVIKQSAEESWINGYVHAAFPMSDLRNDVRWILSIPIKVNRQKTFLVLSAQGFNELQNPEQLEQAAGKSFKYGVLIGTMVLELARVAELSHE